MRDPTEVLEVIFQELGKKQTQGKLAKRQVHTLRNSLDNHKFTSSFRRFFSGDSHPTGEKQ